jgi:hypothetical protein
MGVPSYVGHSDPLGGCWLLLGGRWKPEEHSEQTKGVVQFTLDSAFCDKQGPGGGGTGGAERRLLH